MEDLDYGQILITSEKINEKGQYDYIRTRNIRGIERDNYYGKDSYALIYGEFDKFYDCILRIFKDRGALYEIAEKMFNFAREDEECNKIKWTYRLDSKFYEKFQDDLKKFNLPKIKYLQERRYSYIISQLAKLKDTFDDQFIFDSKYDDDSGKKTIASEISYIKENMNDSDVYENLKQYIDDSVEKLSDRIESKIDGLENRIDEILDAIKFMPIVSGEFGSAKSSFEETRSNR